MSTTVTDPKPFDPIAHIQSRNAADQQVKTAPVVAAKPEEKPAEAKAATEEEKRPDHVSQRERSARRRERQLAEEVGAERARREMLEQRLAALEGKGATKPEAGSEDPEPERGQFSTDAEHQRALGRWDARQEARKVATQATESVKTDAEAREYRESLERLNAKAKEDEKLFPDWAQVAEKASENEDAPEIVFKRDELLVGMLAGSEFRAGLFYHFAKTPAALQKILDLTPKPAEQIKAFHRLESKIEDLYYNQAQKPAAGAAEAKKAPEDRTHLAEADQAGRTAADRDVRKPKPSSEVAAKGGSATPDEPTIGSPAWMERRNKQQFGR